MVTTGAATQSLA